MKFKVGDVVKMNKDTNIYQWYSNKIYTIIYIDNNVAKLNENLPNMNSNEIHLSYLKLLKEERKEKLLKINRL